MLKVFYAIGIFAAAALLSSLAAISYLSSPPPIHSSEHQDAGQPDKEKHTQESHSVSGFVRYLFPDGIAVFTFWLVIATIVLGAGAIIQIGYLERAETIATKSAQAAKDSAEAAKTAVELAGETAERQLRAYVMLGEVDLDTTDIRQPRFKFRIINTGLTPAINVRIGLGLRININPPNDEFYAGNIPTASPAPPTIIGMNRFVEDEKKFSNPLTDLQLANVKSEKWAIYFTGIIEYDDIFGAHRRTKFSLKSTGSMYGADPRMRYTEKGNDIE